MSIMQQKIRSRIGVIAVLLVALLMVACTGSPEAAVDREAIIADAVATIEANQEAVMSEPSVNAESSEAQNIPVVNNGSAVPMTPDLEATLIDLYQRINPSVVYISILSSQFGPVGNGSGFVYDAEGHIITNNHVVADGDAFEVVFGDGTRREAEVIGTDVDSDLAVIKVEEMPEGIEPLVLSDISEVSVGQFVVAIGSPFQQENSMSLGIISALGRSLQSQRFSEQTGGRYSLPQVVQTDAPINPGNSGGPLLNLAGEVVGVNSAIRSATGVNSGVGFSIPVNAVKRIAPSLIENGNYVYPFMGVSIGTVTVQTAEELGLPEANGALIGAVTPGSPADAAGIEANDVVVGLDDVKVRDFSDLNSYLVFNTEVGQSVEVSLYRNGELISLPLELGERP